MPSIEYDPSRSALFTPEKRETIFEAGQNYSLLQLAVEAARLAYFRAEQSASEQQRLASALARVGFGGLRLFGDSKTDTQGFGAYRTDDRTALISFRGTQPDKVTDVAMDLEAHQVPWHESAGNVHGGFAAAARSVISQVEGWLKDECPDRNQLVVTGHSLGAALATLVASAQRATQLITLGSPRVGDTTFAATLAGIDGARIVDCCDAVTEVPPELSIYTHIRPPTYITKDGVRTESPSAETIASDRMHGRIEYFVKYAWKIGTVLVRDLADHAPINYARAFF
jgi:predicted lipase